MRTTKIDIYKEQREWLKQHQHSDHMVVDTDQQVVKVEYLSPVEKWKGHIAPDGTIDVPDMEYYNGLQDPGEMRSFLHELSNGFPTIAD